MVNDGHAWRSNIKNIQMRHADRTKPQLYLYIIRNIDFLRQARRHHAIATATLEVRKRNARTII